MMRDRYTEYGWGTVSLPFYVEVCQKGKEDGHDTDVCRYVHGT